MWNYDDGDDSDDNDDSDNGISTSVDASQKNLDAFSSINADLNVVDLTIQRGNTFSITCKASKKLTPEYKVENNCLTITQYAKAHNAFGRNRKCSVTITVADTLTDLKLHTNVGDVDLSGYHIELGTGVGDVNVNDTYCHRSYSNQGDSSHSLTISNDTGDIRLT